MNTLEQKAVTEIHASNAESKKLTKNILGNLLKIHDPNTFTLDPDPLTYIQVNSKDFITIYNSINELMIHLVNTDKWSMALLNQNNKDA